MFSNRQSWYRVPSQSVWALPCRPMARSKVRSKTDSLSVLEPTRKSLPVWYVLKARPSRCFASQSGKPREP